MWLIKKTKGFVWRLLLKRVPGLSFCTVSCLTLNFEDAVQATGRHIKGQKASCGSSVFFCLTVLELVYRIGMLGCYRWKKLERKGNRFYWSQ